MTSMQLVLLELLNKRIDQLSHFSAETNAMSNSIDSPILVAFAKITDAEYEHAMQVKIAQTHASQQRELQREAYMHDVVQLKRLLEVQTSKLTEVNEGFVYRELRIPSHAGVISKNITNTDLRSQFNSAIHRIATQADLIRRLWYDYDHARERNQKRRRRILFAIYTLLVVGSGVVVVLIAQSHH